MRHEALESQISVSRVPPTPFGTVKAHWKTTFGKKTEEAVSQFGDLETLTASFGQDDFGGRGHSHAQWDRNCAGAEAVLLSTAVNDRLDVGV
jgi:hypothetical protein